MRAIKFRAWDGRALYEWRDLLEFTVEQTFKPDVEVWKVMQFTGLKDKAGREIYEGDVVVNKNEPCKECDGNKREFGAVSWHPLGYWMIGTSGLHLGYNISNMNKGNVADQFNYLEVIGNVHENPELLAQTIDSTVNAPTDDSKVG